MSGKINTNHPQNIAPDIWGYREYFSRISDLDYTMAYTPASSDMSGSSVSSSTSMSRDSHRTGNFSTPTKRRSTASSHVSKPRERSSDQGCYTTRRSISVDAQRARAISSPTPQSGSSTSEVRHHRTQSESVKPSGSGSPQVLHQMHPQSPTVRKVSAGARLWTTSTEAVSNLFSKLRIPSTVAEPNPALLPIEVRLPTRLSFSPMDLREPSPVQRHRKVGAHEPPVMKQGSNSTSKLPDSIFRGNKSLSKKSEDGRYIVYRAPNVEDIVTESMAQNVDKAYEIFLRHHTCYDLIPNSSKLVVLDTRLNVKKAFFALVVNGVRAAPLWDSGNQKFVGMLTITDFIRILEYFSRNSLRGPTEELETQNIARWRDIIGDRPKPLHSVLPDATLLDAVRTLIQTRVHRLPVMDPVSGNPLHILTHKRILKYLHLYMTQMPTPSYMSHTVKELQLGTLDTEKVCKVSKTTPVIKALEIFVRTKVSALPVVDEHDRLVDIYSKFDVINLAATKTYDNLNISVFEALEYRRGRFDGVTTCRKKDTMRAVIDKIVSAEVHRLVVVDKHKRVIGIVSLSDILAYFVQSPDLPVTLGPQGQVFNSIT